MLLKQDRYIYLLQKKKLIISSNFAWVSEIAAEYATADDSKK